MNQHIISNDFLSIERVEEIISSNAQLVLSKESENQVAKCRKYLDDVMSEGDRVIYGINTGFGSLCNEIISPEDLGQLQKNLVMSHACGTGDKVPQNIVKIMLLLKIQGLSYGHSGVQLDTINRLIDFYNNDVIPVVYQQGSLGASGDLAPLAHIAMAVLGMGEVYYQNEITSTEEINKKFNWKGIELQSKEGLALLNGAQFMSAYGTWNVIRSGKLLNAADLISATSLEGYDGRISPFTKEVNEIRNQIGQIKVAERMRTILAGSELIEAEKVHVQDPYSFRCVPQVHGASRDAFDYIRNTVEKEINAVTDNPTIFPDQDLVVSAGNFHGQPLALSMDNLSIAMSEIGSISERRTYKLISGTRGLPAFLVAKPGLSSGFMIPQYTAASIASQNKHLAVPACTDSIDSSNGQEDHVSMGANSATKLDRIIDNVERILAIELFNATQALEFRRPKKSSVSIENLFSSYRNEVKFIDVDKYMHPEIQKSVQFIKTYSWK